MTKMGGRSPEKYFVTTNQIITTWRLHNKKLLLDGELFGPSSLGGFQSSIALDADL
ncbi:MAG: hypothetical protein WA782_18680 [Sulfitobacter sp.]